MQGSSCRRDKITQVNQIRLSTTRVDVRNTFLAFLQKPLSLFQLNLRLPLSLVSYQVILVPSLYGDTVDLGSINWNQWISNSRVNKLKLSGVESGLGGLPKHRSNFLIIVFFSLDELSLGRIRSSQYMVSGANWIVSLELVKLRDRRNNLGYFEWGLVGRSSQTSK